MKRSAILSTALSELAMNYVMCTVGYLSFLFVVATAEQRQYGSYDSI